MKKTKKRIVGLSLLGFVAGMTGLALTIPSPDASAVSVGGEVEVVVRVYPEHPEIVINTPLDGSLYTTYNVHVNETYSGLDSLINNIDWGEGSAEVDDLLYGTSDSSNSGNSGSGGSGFGLGGGFSGGGLLGAGGSSAASDDTIDYTTADSADRDFDLNLRALGNYDTYKLVATLKSGESTLTDSTTFRYAPVSVKYIGTDENGDPVYQLDYDECTNYVDLAYSLGDDTVYTTTYNVPNPGTAGSTTITIPALDKGLVSGDYTLSATAHGAKANAEVTGSSYISAIQAIRADFDYDDNTSEVYFLLKDANGKTIYLPDAHYTVENPGTASSDSFMISLRSIDLEFYDISSYTLVASAYPPLGSTKNIGQLDGPVSASNTYKRPDSPVGPVTPDVPDTGIAGVLNNFSSVDYWIAGLLICGTVTALALRKMNQLSQRK